MAQYISLRENSKCFATNSHGSSEPSGEYMSMIEKERKIAIASDFLSRQKSRDCLMKISNWSLICLEFLKGFQTRENNFNGT